MILEILTLLAAWVLWWGLKTYRNLKDMPPGPIPLPLIGNCLQMRFGLIRSHEKLHQQYGDIYTLTFPHTQMVVLNSGELLREALVTKGDDTAGRQPHIVFPFYDIYQGTGIIPTDFGHRLLFRRKIFKTAMHLFGGAAVAETQKRAYSAVRELLNTIDAQHGKPFTLRPYIRRGIIVRVWEWLRSSECAVSEETIAGLDELQQMLIEVGTLGQNTHFVPFYAQLSGKFRACLKAVERQRENLIQKVVERHIAEYDSDGNHGLIDSFIKGYKKELAKEKTKQQLSEVDIMSEIKGLVIDTIIGATDTTIATITWFFLYMILYPEIQRRIQAELDEVIGREEFPKWQDATKLPYLQATTYEVLRHSSVVSILVRNAAADITLAGYKVPKGTTIYGNGYIAYRNSGQWSRPKVFDPERFIDAEGQLKSDKDFLPFGGGTRKCPGEVAANIQVFIFTACLLQRFDFSTVNDASKPSLQPRDEFMVVNYPNDYALIAVERK